MLRIRQAEPSDQDAIRAVQARNGMSDLDRAAWAEMWRTYPFAAEFVDVPSGWVIETDAGQVVGNLDNAHALYEFGGRRLRATVASGWAVDVEHRGKALNLLTTFLRQKNVDLTLVVSAAESTAKVMTALKAPRIPIPDYGRPCFWPVNRRAFARAALERRGVKAAGVLAWPAGMALGARDLAVGSGSGQPASAPRRLTAFDERFDSLWERVAAGSARLRGVRTRTALEWRYRPEFRSGRAAIVAAERGAELAGYALLVRRAGSDLGMSLYDVADMQAAGDDGGVYRDLLLGAVRAAREDGVDAVKFVTGTPAKRGPAEALRPYTYQVPIWQLYYKAASKELEAELDRTEAWDFSVFDTF